MLFAFRVGFPQTLFAAMPAKNLLLPDREKLEMDPDRLDVACERPDEGIEEAGVCEGRLVLIGVALYGCAGILLGALYGRGCAGLLCAV